MAMDNSSITDQQYIALVKDKDYCRICGEELLRSSSWIRILSKNAAYCVHSKCKELLEVCSICNKRIVKGTECICKRKY